MRYLVLGRQPWNRADFESVLKRESGEWLFCRSSSDLVRQTRDAGQFRYLFFLHWSEKVPMHIVDQYECVCFHMTDVPYGRGGSPLQNLIARGHRETMLTALRMTSRFDAGPVYMKRPLSLEGGTAEEIYQRASRSACEMARQIAREEPASQPQAGEPTVFSRRTPEQSELSVESADLLRVFDHIRMLDAHGYPRAFVELGHLRFEFSRVALYHDGIRADVRITERDGTSRMGE